MTEAKSKITMALVSRPVENRAVLDLGEVSAIVESGDKERLFDYFRAVTGVEAEIHDSYWLRNLVNWSEDSKGMDTFEMIKWAELVKSMLAAEDKHGKDEDYEIEISRGDAERLRDKMKNKEYKQVFSIAYVDFVEMFMNEAGYKMP